MRRKESFANHMDFISSKSLNIEKLKEHEKKAKAAGLVYVSAFTMEGN